jgi:hypothetical protein
MRIVPASQVCLLFRWAAVAIAALFWFLVQSGAAEVPRPAPPLIVISLEQLSKANAQWNEVYRLSKGQDASGSEEVLRQFFKAAIARSNGVAPRFVQASAYVPAKFIVECFSYEVSIPILQRLKADYPGPEYAAFRSALDSSIAECFAIWREYGKAAEFLASPDVRRIAGEKLEQVVFALSSRVLVDEGQPALAATICSNFFGSLATAAPRYCTNSQYFNHLAAVAHAIGDGSEVIRIYESMRTNRPDTYAENLYHNNGALSQAYRERGQYESIVAITAADLEAMNSGKIRVSAQDKRLMENLGEQLEKQGWLDKTGKAARYPPGTRHSSLLPVVGICVLLVAPLVLTVLFLRLRLGSQFRRLRS